MSRWIRAAVAALLGVGVLLGPPVLLVRFVGNPWPADGLTWGGTLSDDAIRGLLAVVVWLLWAQLLACVVLETAAALSHRPPRMRVPAFGWQRDLARRLVTSLLIATAAAPVLTTAAPAAASAPAYPTQATSGPVTGPVAGQPADPATALGGGPAAAERPARAASVGHPVARQHGAPTSGVRVTVHRGDTLWSLAQSHLGDGNRWSEIAALNEGHPMPDGAVFRAADQIRPGWELRLPAKTPAVEHTPRSAEAQYRVRPGDTLSAIAETRLGDATDWPRIFRTNQGRLEPDGQRLVNPDLIRPGWRLTLPRTEAEPETTTNAPVGTDEDPATARGDHGTTAPAGGPGHSKAREEPRNGATTLRYGEMPITSTQPGSVPASPPATRAPLGPAQPSLAPTPSGRRTGEVAGSRSGTSQPSGSSSGESNTETSSTSVDDSAGQSDSLAWSVPWMLAGLSGAGAILAAGLLAALRRHRRDQFRVRRPGHGIAAPDAELSGVEKSIHAAGAPVLATVEFADAALRRLAAACVASDVPMPSPVAVELTEDHLVLHLAAPAALPGSWVDDDGAQRHWLLAADTDLSLVGPAEPAGQPAPWPMLVTIGTSQAGDRWLLNLEETGCLALTGDRDRVEAFARYLAAEIAVNSWSRDVHADCIGIAEEVEAMNPARLHAHPAGAAARDAMTATLTEAVTTIDRAAAEQTTVVPGRVTGAGEELWTARLLLLAPGALADDEGRDLLQQLRRLVGQHRGCTAVALVIAGDEAPETTRQTTPETTPASSPASTPDRTVTVQLDADGQLRLPIAGLRLTAVGLSRAEAEGCSALLAQSRDLSDTPEPVMDADPAYPRTTPAGQLKEPVASILNARDQEYLESSATTGEDLELLAPRFDERVRREAADDDPGLDADVAAWFAESCPRPRLSVLGPRRARTRGSVTGVADRLGYYTEMLAYLALHPAGVTSEQAAEAFGVAPVTIRKDMNTLRDWLGPNPVTGAKNPPDARQSRAAKQRGGAFYQIDELLWDGDLFERLTRRGRRRGPDGITDLYTALELVNGEPFADMADRAWLVEGAHPAHRFRREVIDVAHLIVVHALHKGDLSLANTAVETAALVAAHDEIVLLDQVAIRNAEGHRAEAERIVREELRGYRLDGEPPLDLSERTEEILRRWASKTAS
jgi:nucleoid-associated protein YgaU